jgi:hypothetical protein
MNNNISSHVNTLSSRPSSLRRVARAPLLALLAAAACAGSGSNSQSGRSAVLTLAAAPSASDTPAARESPPTVQITVQRISDTTLRDPAQRQLLMLRIARQVAGRTQRVPAARYQQDVRPRLQRQLLDAGFAPDEVGFILDDIDTTRDPRPSP